MPKPLQYRAGSLIYFQGDPADKIFILQSGAVNLVYQDIEKGEDVHDLVQPGEFFGVKSALGRFPREENSVALQDSSLMTFTVPEFEALAISNTRIVMKMLKVFSNQLRKIHKQVASLMEKEDQHNPEDGLYSLGEYYFKASKYSQARYVFNRYITYYPSGLYAVQAADSLHKLEAMGGQAKGPQQSVQPQVKAAFSNTQDQANTASAKAYYDAVSMLSQQKYQQAYLAFKKIIDANEDVEFVAKSTFESGRCLFYLNKYEDCIQYFTTMITKYPKHPDLPDSLFYMCQSYEKSNKKEQAMTFYKKILSMPGDTEDGVHSKARRAVKELEEQ